MTTDTTQFQREINEYSNELQQRQRSMLQQYPARYYDFMGEDGQREANMVVVLDSQGRAMQAVLQYDHTLPTFTQNKVQRQAQGVLGSRFLGSGPSTPLYIFEFGDQLARVDVDHTGEDAQSGPEGSVNLLYIALGILGMFLVVGLLFWMLNSLFRGRQEIAVPTATPPALAQAANAPATAVTLPTVDVTAPGIQTNSLPGSKLANPAIGIGTTVKIRPGLRSFVRSEPGSDQGEVVGYMQDGDTALTVGGPTWLQGDSDTIVWWYVELPDGVRGWTPANTSQFTLLDVVQ
jgi:hypothetical protein